MAKLIWLELVTNIICQMGYMLVSPLFWLVVAVVWWQNKRLSKQKSRFFHLPEEKVWKKTAISVALGIFGGFIAGIMLLVLGINIAEIGIDYLWILAIVLALINPRFVCFAYSGGILAAVNALFGVPALAGAQVLALIGVLHFVEGILVCLSGHLQAMPVYIKWRDGRIVGAFNMQNFWPIPLIALYLDKGTLPYFEEIIMMPEWWPLIPSMIKGGFTIYMLVAVLAALGYSDLAVTQPIRNKTKKAAGQLIFYGIGLIILAFLSERSRIIAFLAALAAPLGHELIIYLGKKAEKKGEPLFVECACGIRVLDVLEGYAAKKAGLKSGDIILQANGSEMHDYAELSGGNWLLKRNNERMRIWMPAHEEWGIIPVPRAERGSYLYFGGNFILLKLFREKAKKLKKKLKN